MTHPLPSATCPDCGAPLPPDSPQALCPACLMRQALASRTIAQDNGKLPHLPPPSPEEIAGKFPGYEILECLGRGGMGVVYKARQKSLNRLVAIKILAPERVGEEKFAERFSIEAELLAKLSHPHIVTIHDFGITDSQPSTLNSQPLYYLVMEFIDGVNLRDLLREGKLEPQQALAIVPPVCEALQYAHDKGIVHRDIKPENLLLDRDGRIKIADFGIASLIGAEGESAGTPPYMAPEQSGSACGVDSRADIYALGVVLYEMLTGERPNKNLVAPSKKVQIDVRLDEIVLRALEKTPELRYQTAGEFRTVLETMVGMPPSPLPNPADEFATRACESLYATPEYLATTWGSMKLHEGMATLALYSDRLVVGRGWQTTTIPFHAVRKLSVVKYPRCLSLKGLHSILVEYEEAGKLQRILLTPRRGGSFFSLSICLFSSVTETNQCVYEWFLAIREAITATKGQPPDGSATPELYQDFSIEGLLWAKLSLLMSGLLGLPVLAILILTGTRLLRNPGPEIIYIPCGVIGMGITFLIVRSLRKQWQRDNPLPPTVGEPKDPAAKMVASETHARFSGTAIVGALLVFLFPALVVFKWLISGSQNIGSPQNTDQWAYLLLICSLPFIGSTIIGWVAVSQIRRSTGKLYGMWLAVIDGLFFPLLVMDAAVILPVIRYFQQVSGLGMNPFWTMFLIGFGVIGLITSNVFIIRRVWRAVNCNNPTAPPQTGSTDKPTRFLRKAIVVAAYVCMALSFAVLFTKQWNERKREGVWVPARISDTITKQYGDAQVRVVDVSQIGQVVLVSFVCEMFRPDHELRVQYGGPVLSYPNDLASSVKTKVKDLDCLIVPRAKIVDDNIGEVLAGTNVLSGQTMFRIGFVLPDSQTAAQVVKAVQEVHLGKPRGLGEGGSVLLLFSLRRDFGKDAAGKPVVEGLDASLWSRPKSNATAGHMPAASPELSFGPVVERTMTSVEIGDRPDLLFLDFESGQFHQPPPALAQELRVAVGETAIGNPKRCSSALYDWLKQTGVDVVAGNLKSETELWFIDRSYALISNATVGKGFDSVTPSQVRTEPLSEPGIYDPLQLHRAPLQSWHYDKKQDVVVFRTREGNSGILQVVSLTENPPGVKIRYKLVQSGRFIRRTGGYPLGEAGSVVLTSSSDGRVSLAVTVVEGTSRDTNSIPDFCKMEGWFVYIESPKRVWIFDGIRQLDLVTPDGRDNAGNPSIRALCPQAVWDAVPESVRKLYRDPQTKPAGDTPGRQAANTSLDPARPLESLAAATKELVVKHFPDAQVSLSDDEFTASHATQEFQIHNQSKTGEATPEAAKETGPSFTGFILRISRKDNAEISQAAVPQTLREPYWSTFINSGYNPASKRGVWIRYAFGGRLNAGFHKQMLELLSLRAMGSEGFGAGTTLGVFNNTAKTRSETITIAADGALTVAGEPCPPYQLAERLGKLASKSAVSVVVHADEKVPSQQVKSILDACKAAGISDVRLATP